MGNHDDTKQLKLNDLQGGSMVLFRESGATANDDGHSGLILPLRHQKYSEHKTSPVEEEVHFIFTDVDYSLPSTS